MGFCIAMRILCGMEVIMSRMVTVGMTNLLQRSLNWVIFFSRTTERDCRICISKTAQVSWSANLTLKTKNKQNPKTFFRVFFILENQELEKTKLQVKSTEDPMPVPFVLLLFVCFGVEIAVISTSVMRCTYMQIYTNINAYIYSVYNFNCVWVSPLHTFFRL